MLMLNWPLILFTTLTLYILIILCLPFSALYATIFLFALIAFWSRMPGVGVPHPFYILYNADVVDIFTLLISINVGIFPAIVFTVFCNMWSRMVGVYPDVRSDKAGLIMPYGEVILNAREYNTREGYHVITAGYSMTEARPDTEIRRVIDAGLEHGALVTLDHVFVDNWATRTAGHIGEKQEQFIEGLCKEYAGQIALEWNAYCHAGMRNMIKTGAQMVMSRTPVPEILMLLANNTSGNAERIFEAFTAIALHDFRYHDVNKKVEELSAGLAEQGHNVPIVADTDLHARKPSHLKLMGTSRMIMDIDAEMPADIVSQMRDNIFSGDHTNVKKYVSPMHLLTNFCIPVLMPGRFRKPRA